MKNISYARYSIVKSAIRLILSLTLAAFLLCGCGRGSSGPTVRPGTTDEMWGNEVDDAEIYVNGKSLGGSVSEEDLLLKQDKIDIVAASGTTLLADVNKYYRFDSPVSTLAVTLPTPDDTSHIQCLTLFFTTDTNPNVTLSGSGNNVDYFDGYSIDASTSYELNVMWNGLKWIVAYGIVG